VTALRLVGAVLAVVAVVIAVSPQVQGGIAPWVLILPLAAGLGLGWQQAANGQIRELSGSPLAATFFNFFFGTLVLVIVLAVHAIVAGLPDQVPGNPLLYVGGALGIVFVAGYAVVVRFTGVLLLGLGAIAGQLTASLVFDLALPVAAHPIAGATIVGTILTFVAVAIAAIPVRATSGTSPR
jgi:transporter family-2 protein